MHNLTNQTLEECVSCNKEYNDLWVFFHKRTKSYSSQWKITSNLPKGWQMLQCPECTNALLVKENLTRPTFNSRYEINYRFVSEQDANFAIRWNQSKQEAPNSIKLILKEIEASTAQYDYIFAGPPYGLPILDSIPDRIFRNKLLKPDGWLVLEHNPNHDFKEHSHYWQERNYGKTIFSFFREEEATS